MKKNSVLLITLLLQCTTLFSQVIKFKEDTVSITEAKTPVIVLINISVSKIPTEPFKIVVKDTHDGDATSKDYSLENKDSLILFAAKNSSSVVSFPITVLPDDKKEDIEDILLYLYYHKDLTGGKDTIIKDSVIIRINDFVPKKINENPAIEYTKRFYFKDTAFTGTVKATGNEYEINICKQVTKDCKAELISEDISGAEFTGVFRRLLSKLIATDPKTDLSAIQGFADSLFLGWKGKTADEKKEKEEKAANEKFNKELNAIQSKLDELLKGRDTAKGDIVIKLGKTYVYKRIYSINNVGEAEKANQQQPKQEPLFDIRTSYKYVSDNKTDTITIDSVSLRIESGYITSMVIYPDTSDHNFDKLELNRITVFRKFIDLRSAREAAENLDLYLPLESKYTYYWYKIKGDGSTKRVHGTTMSDNGSRENPIDNIYTDWFIYLPDLIKYSPRIDSLSDVLLHIKDKNLGFGKNSKKSVTLDDKDFSSFAQVNIFSDLVGLAEDKPNGLIQAEGKFEVGLFTQPLGNSRYYYKNRWNIFNSVTLSVAITKIENKLKYIIAGNDSAQLYDRNTKDYDPKLKKVKNIRTIDLIQFKNLDVSLKLNLVKFESDFTTITLYTGIGINRIPINDTTHGKDSQGKEIVSDNKEVYSALKTFGGIKIKNKITSKLGAEWGVDFIHMSLRSDKFKQTYNYYSYDSLRNIVRERKYKPSFEVQTLVPNFLLYYNIDQDLTKRIYVRTAYFYSTKSKTDNFFSFQFGYSTDMKGLFKIFTKE
jgi:hypothetical protein